MHCELGKGVPGKRDFILYVKLPLLTSELYNKVLKIYEKLLNDGLWKSFKLNKSECARDSDGLTTTNNICMKVVKTLRRTLLHISKDMFLPSELEIKDKIDVLQVLK